MIQRRLVRLRRRRQHFPLTGLAASPRAALSNHPLVITRWTIWIALCFCVLAATCLLGNRRNRESQRWARWAWTLGLSFYLGHVISAFHYSHGWSHARAYEHTALETARVVSWAWGGGLYFNYAFTVAWLIDVVWWWSSLERHRARPRWIGYSFRSFFAFIAFNATVVFGQGAIRWFGLAAFVGLGLLCIVTMWTTKGHESSS